MRNSPQFENCFYDPATESEIQPSIIFSHLVKSYNIGSVEVFTPPNSFDFNGQAIVVLDSIYDITCETAISSKWRLFQADFLKLRKMMKIISDDPVAVYRYQINSTFTQCIESGGLCDNQKPQKILCEEIEPSFSSTCSLDNKIQLTFSEATANLTLPSLEMMNNATCVDDSQVYLSTRMIKRQWEDIEENTILNGKGYTVNMTIEEVFDPLFECESACLMDSQCLGYSVSTINLDCKIVNDFDYQEAQVIGYTSRKIITAAAYVEFENPCFILNETDVASTWSNISTNVTYGDHISIKKDEAEKTFFFGEVEIPEYISVNLVVEDPENGEKSNILINGEFFDTVDDESVFLCIDNSGVYYAETIADINNCQMFFGIGENQTFASGNATQQYNFLNVAVENFGDGILDCFDSKNYIYAS
jgi:hypothetical protein